MEKQHNVPRRRKGRNVPKQAQVGPRASREAYLGADGLRVTRASGIVPVGPSKPAGSPARAQDSTSEPPQEERSQASREAMLGKDGLRLSRGLGTVPASPRRGRTSKK